MKKLFILFFVFILSIYFLTSAGRTPYDYFTRLSDSFLHGKYYLTENPPWLNELIPWKDGKFYFVNPPMPALLAVPFVAIFKDKFEQQYLAHIIGALIATIAMIISKLIKKDNLQAVWVGIFVGLSTIIWFLSSVGSVWYLGQITGTLFVMLAIFEVLNQKRPFLIGVLLSFAFLSRLQLIPSLIFFFFLSTDLKLKNIARLFLGLSIFLVVYSGYNYLRFGDIFQTGYRLLPGIFDEPWFNKGQFSLSYIPNHLSLLFLKLPNFSNTFPYISPSWAGLAIWITSPAFIYSLLAPRNKIVLLSWLSIIGIGLINFSYGSTGFTQFGYRYAVDFYPFLILLTILGISTKKLSWHHWILLSIGIVVNLWGVLWINKFGWVSF